MILHLVFQLLTVSTNAASDVNLPIQRGSVRDRKLLRFELLGGTICARYLVSDCHWILDRIKLLKYSQSGIRITPILGPLEFPTGFLQDTSNIQSGLLICFPGIRKYAFYLCSLDACQHLKQ